MIWSAHAIQDNRAMKAAKFLSYPKQAVTTDIQSKYAAYKWELETLITLDLNTPKTREPIWAGQPLNVTQFTAVAETINLVRAIDEHESQGRIDVTNILLEMHRISHRQFAWQRGFKRTEDIYRYLYIYGQGECASYFEKTYGVSVLEFFTVAFGLCAYHCHAPWQLRVRDMNVLKVSQVAIEKSLRLLSDDIWAVRRQSTELLAKFEKNLNTKLPANYQPSYLRLKPIIRRALATEDQYIAPLPELIIFRATVGLYYDLQSGGTSVTNDANKRFDEYARRSIKAHCPDFEPAPAQKYYYRKNSVETPDILLKQREKIVAVFECKATKLTFEAQYSDSPVESAERGYSQIAKAIFQLWRFFSHVRRGIIDLDVAPNAPAIVLTMDAWTQMSGELRNALITEAAAIAADKDPEIIDEDKRQPVFCPIKELDELLVVSNEEQLLAAFHAAIEVKYHGWSVVNVREQAVPVLEKAKDFAFNPSEWLPWWEDMMKSVAEKRNKSRL